MTNTGFIDVTRGNAYLTGKDIFHNGIIRSATSVALNGRVDIDASYDAKPNTAYKPSERPNDVPFLFQKTGTVKLGANSVIQILPEYSNAAKVPGTELALKSQVNIRGLAVYLGPNSTIHAPGGKVNVNAGEWDLVQTASSGTNRFVRSAGQIYLDRGALINVAGTADAAALLEDYILTLQLRGGELAGSPLQRDSIFRNSLGTGQSITVDLRQAGTYNGFRWVGTPLADLSGYLNLIQRSVSELTTAGGEVNLNAGASVVMQPGSKIDVSGGWVNYSGGMVKTTRVMLGGHIFDIADAPPDRIYPSIYTGEFTKTHSRWGVSRTYTVPFMTGEHYDPAYFSGAAGGKINISAAGVALDGTLLGQTVAGPRQERTGHAGSETDLPPPSSFALSLTAEKFVTGIYPVYSPTPGDVIFQAGSQTPAGPFALDSTGTPVALRADRLRKIILSPDLFTTSGFGSVSVENPDGRITVPRNVELKAPAQGALTLKAANIDVFGSIVIPGGTVDATVYNISPFEASENLRDPLLPAPSPNSNRGIFTLGSGATISTAGLIIDDRFSNAGAFSQPVVTDGGLVSINSFTTNLSSGSLIDVSGGVRMDPWGERTYGNGGSIVIKTGQDINLKDVIGGTLTLGGTLLGRSGAEGGSLSLQALLIQVGGRALHPLTTLFQPDFFNQGGFANFTLTGLGLETGTAGKFVPAVYIAPGTRIEPVAESYVALPNGGPDGGLGIQTVQKPVGLRSPVSLFFEAPGVEGKEGPVIRGDIIFGEGAVIRTDPLATVSFKGNTVAVLGSVSAPGGTIQIAGSRSSNDLQFGDTIHALTTVYIGSNSTLSTAGTTIFYPDAYGRRNGEVLPGGTISVSGNIVAAAGAVLDVSGASNTLDFHPTSINPLLNYVVPHSSGLTSPLYSLRTVPLRVDSNGGTIILEGGQMLHVDATLRGFAGGPTALGGQLFVTSGRFYEKNVIPPVTDTNLVVTQSGSTIGRPLPDNASAIGQAMLNANGTFTIGRGYFAASSFTQGGFDSLALNGVVEFKGPVSINARGFLRVADGGFIAADSDVRLSAPYVFLGQNFVPPVLPEDRIGQIPFTNVPPTYGPGRLFVTANHIDLGTLSLQNIGKAVLTANGGDIRGNGIFNIAGELTLKAAQIYPTTLNEFSIFAYDYTSGGLNKSGKIRIEQSGSAYLPLSAGGTLSLYASIIEQFGTLRAPMGVINLGWDGTGTAPKDLITGTALPAPITTSLTLGAGSVTSVSGVDPLTGRGILVPYGYTDGTSWFDPRGFDITGGGLPEKAINLSAGNIDMRAGSTIDLRGGGDLLAFQWVSGNGGQVDILGQPSGPWTANTAYKAGDLVTHHGHTYSARLNSQGVTPSISLFWTEVPQTYAVVPGYNPNFAPYSPFNGYTDNSISAGDRIFLGGSSALPSGYYTLLPSRYALLPGAVLVTPKSAMPIGSVQLATGASFVSGYIFNDLNQQRTVPTLSQRFEVAPAEVINARAEYRTFYANDFLSEAAQRLNIDTPRLPGDSGYLLFQATQSLNLQGRVLSQSLSGGRGSSIDIAAALAFDITGSPGAPVPGTVSLDADVLRSWGAESLIIGGRRTRTTAGTTVTVLATSISVNNAGSPLTAPDLTLVSQGNITLAPGSQIRSSGTLSDAENYLITGNGTALRVSQDLTADIIRTGVTPGGSPTLTVGAGAQLSGGSLVLDSTSNMVVDPSASLIFKAYSFNSGRISLQLDNPGALQPSPGLVLTTSFLDNLQSVQSLSLLSYSSIDLYGTGTLGNSSLGRLALNAGEIRGFNQNGGNVAVAADTLVLGNKANVATVGVVTPATGDLSFTARSIQLAVNDLAIDQFSTVSLNAAQSITGTGKGGLAVQNALSISTPLLTGAAGSQRSLSAGGTLSVLGPGGTSSATGGGLGATLGITGQNVSIGTSIALPSGSLSFRSTAGNLSITGSLDVGGTAQTFYDQTRYTDAGQITLTADAGNVNLAAGSNVNVAANSAGGNAGTLVVSAASGTFTTDGTLSGKGGTGGSNGSFVLDIAALPTLAPLAADLSTASLINSQSIRVRTGDVIIDGTSKVNAFRLSTDVGGITVTGTIDASGNTGGTISLASRGNLVLNSGSTLTVAAQTFNSAGKGGAVTLESGTQANGSVGTGVVDIQSGSTIDLSVSAMIAGDATLVGSSAFNGQYTGKLHIRAPRNGAGTDMLVDAIDGNILNASSILVEGYKLYDLTGSGAISSAIQTAIFNDAQSFLGTAGTTTANYTSMTNRLLANNAGLSSVFVLAPGAEIINTTGDLTLGATNSNTTADWNLSTFRFGAKSAAGVLTLRAAGSIQFHNALSDGFNPTLANSDPNWLWLARLTAQNPNLPVNTQSWSYRITAGADLSASDFRQVQPLSLLGSSGTLTLGKDGGAMVASGDANALTESVIGANLVGGGRGLFQVIRTGSGDIDITTGRSVQLLNQFATIYSAGTRVADATLGGTFDQSALSQVGGAGVLGANQQNYPMTFSVAGGNVNISAGADIERLGSSSSRELPNNWLYRRGYVDASGQFAQGGFGTAISSTAWWIDFSNFFQGIGALGGGNVSLQAANNITNIDAVAPTNARVTKSQGANLAAASQLLVELGGGDVTVRAGKDIDAGVFYVERGRGILSAGGEIKTNATRSMGQINTATGANAVLPESTWLATTLFVGKGGFDISAQGNVLLGPVANPFLLPVGLGNSFWNKTYFSTYSPESYVNVSSLGGELTLRQGTYVNNVFLPALEGWSQTQQLLSSSSSSYRQPWLRLAESSVAPFRTAAGLLPGVLRATAYSGDINVVGNLTLSPSATGTIDLLTRGGINGLKAVGFNTNENKTVWVASRINVSDASPASIPGVFSPFAYQSVPGVGPSASQAITTRTDFLINIDQIFRETGATLGTQASQQVKQTLHAAGLLHANDPAPVRLYAGTEDISGLTLFSPKAARVVAGRDISDVALYLQNLDSDDLSVVSSGRDIIPYNPNSPLRIASKSGDNMVVEGFFQTGNSPLAGDLQISGPGTLEVLAGRNLDLGTGSSNADGTGSGITSIGNARNPYLPFEGASLIVGAGIGPSLSLFNSNLDFDNFISTILGGAQGTRYLSELSTNYGVTSLAAVQQLEDDKKAQVALQLFYLALRDAGRDKSLGAADYAGGLEAIDALFGGGPWAGDIFTRERDIRTKSGGDISIFAPGGGLSLAQTVSRDSLIPPGIITEAGGSINIFTDGDVNLGVSRIFTLRGGDITIWSTTGDIAAGASSKTVASAPPTRVLIDPTSADVTTDLAGLATGGGIGVLATVAGVPPGNVDLIAPMGVIDAGDAGIRSTGNLNIAAVSVLNASNISVAGSSVGTPAAPVVSAPNIGGITSASSSAGASTAAASSAMPQQRKEENLTTQELPSIMTVEVLGYGGSEDDDEDEEAKRKR
ncbi:MAG: filamentous hemagglutinin family protein [Verrucomicrobiaceae bacterium]